MAYYRDSTVRRSGRLALVVIGVLVSALASAEVPLESFAKHPDIYDLKISPLGHYLALRVPVGDGHTGIAVLDRSTLKVISRVALGEHHTVSEYWWVSPNRLVVAPAIEYGTLAQPLGTGELIGFDADGADQQYLFGYRDAEDVHSRQIGRAGAAEVLSTLPTDPLHAIITVDSFYNTVDSGHIETYRLNLRNGLLDHRDVSPVKGASTVLTDHAGNLRIASGSNNFEDVQLRFRPAPGADWVPMQSGGTGNSRIEPLAFSLDDSRIYLTTDDLHGTQCLVERSLPSSVDNVLSCVKDAELGTIEFSFDDNAPIARRYVSDRPVIEAVGPPNSDQTKLKQLAASFPGSIVAPVSHTTDGSKVVVLVESDRDPGGYYLFDTRSLRADPLLAIRDWIDPAQMAVQKAVSYAARDGRTIRAFLTLPNGVPAKNLPLVTMPHGGPFGIADEWGWNAEAQLLASRGYAVLQPNYRGSSGYGAAFVLAGRYGWDSVMIDDITDGTRWAVAQGLADPKRLCVFGASFGGYAALMSAVREPDLYRCAIGYAGIYDLRKWKRDSDVGDSDKGLNYIQQFIGATPERLRAASPISYVDRLKAAVMIVHGVDDQRVPFSQATALRDELDARHYPYEWLAMPGEGHGFYKEKHRVELYARLLKFLDTHIGKTAAGAPSTAETAPDSTAPR